MAIEPRTFGLDSTDWTALGAVATFLGTMVALGIALSPWIKSKFLSPKLVLKIEDASKFSSSLDNGFSFWARIPVENSTEKSTAQDVEVFLESVIDISTAEEKPIESFFPMRLRWTHTGKTVCDRIPGETSKLLDFGTMFPPSPTCSKLMWRFNGEPDDRYAPRAWSAAILKVSVILSAQGVAPRRQVLKIVFSKDESGAHSVKFEDG